MEVSYSTGPCQGSSSSEPEKGEVAMALAWGKVCAQDSSSHYAHQMVVASAAICHFQSWIQDPCYFYTSASDYGSVQVVFCGKFTSEEEHQQCWGQLCLFQNADYFVVSGARMAIVDFDIFSKHCSYLFCNG